MARKPKAPSLRPKENIVGENIRYLLEQRGESAAKLARAIGVYHKTVYFWIHGSTVPDSISRQKVCDYFAITEAQLFSKGLAIGTPSPKEDAATQALLSTLNLQGVSPDDLQRLSSEQKKILEDLIKDWSSRRSRQVQQIRTAQAPVSPDGSDHRKRILIVDDEARGSFVLMEKLQEMGYRIDLAADGEEGLQRTEEFKPHLILLDLLMEGIDGAEFLKRLREKDSQTPVIVISSFPSEISGVYTGEHKLAGYYEKPIHLEDLLIKIEKLTGGPK